MFSKSSLLFYFSFALATCPKPLLLAAETSARQIEKKHLEIEAKEADRYFEATLYDKAIPLYHELLSHSPTNPEYVAWIRLRLARCYLFTNQFSKIPGALSEINSTDGNSNPRIQKLSDEALFLLGISYNKIGQHDQAITALLNYLSLDKKGLLPFYEDAQYELGVAYFHAKKFPEATAQFEVFSEKSLKKRLFPLSRIYLARIAIKEERFSDAERILNIIAKQEVSDDLLQHALSFLHGEILFRQKDWLHAADHFEKTLPLRNQDKADWYEDTLYYLGWCYLNLGNDAGQSPGNQTYYFDKAETIFRKNLALFPSDRAYLALGQCYLAKSLRLDNAKALEELEALFSDTNLFDSRDTLHQALLLRAESSRSYAERRNLFRQLTHESNADSPYYANAWYLRGLNELEEAQVPASAEGKTEAKKHLNDAIEALSKAFDLLYPTDKKLAALTLKYQAQAYSCQNSRDGYIKGLALLGTLLNKYRNNLFPLLDEPDEVFYLQGLNASNLADKEEGKIFFDTAINSLTHAIESYPDGKYYDDSLNLLGALYYRQGDFEKAKETYFELATATPESPFVGEALFWVANCIDNLEGDASQSKLYRRQIFEQYPHTFFADEAYFRYYNYQEYLRGIPEAIEHLKALETKFPDTPFRINAHYLIGLDLQQERKSEDRRTKRDKDPAAAIEAFQKAEAAFDSLYCNSSIPEDKLEYFITLRYRAILEKALTMMKLPEEQENTMEPARFENAEKILLRMYTDFENPNHSLAKALASGESYSRLQEECACYLAKCYIKANNDKAGEKIISKTLEKYKSSKITRGYYLSRLRYLQGIINAKWDKNDLALENFTQAGDAGKGKILSTDELLDLWIQQSLCYRALNRMDEAMLLLSKVINYDAVSANRLKAMYLRARIYEEQGRHELARKQLEATAQKGGRWALKAKEKLEKNYVYQ